MWRMLALAVAGLAVMLLSAARHAWAHGGGVEDSLLPWSFPEVFFAFGAYAAFTLLGFLLGRIWYDVEPEAAGPALARAGGGAASRPLLRVLPGRRDEGVRGR